MSTNTLIAFIVGLMFLLCVIVVLSCFADRRARYRRSKMRHATSAPGEDTLVQEKWPQEGAQ